MWDCTRWWVLLSIIHWARAAKERVIRDRASGSGHWQMCRVFSSSCQHRGHLAWGHRRRIFIIFPVAQ